jgi:hypothetical protein
MNDEVVNVDTVVINNEEDAWNALQYIKDRFGWQVSVYDRDDVDDWMGRRSTDDEWFTIRTSKAWRDNIILDFEPEHRYEAMCDMMNDLGIPQSSIVTSPSAWTYRSEQENGDNVDCWECGKPLDDNQVIVNDDNGYAYHAECFQEAN